MFAQEGASVVAADRNLAAAARTVDGGDVSVAGDVEAMVDKAERVLQAIKTSSVEIFTFLAPKTN